MLPHLLRVTCVLVVLLRLCGRRVQTGAPVVALGPRVGVGLRKTSRLLRGASRTVQGLVPLADKPVAIERVPERSTVLPREPLPRPEFRHGQALVAAAARSRSVVALAASADSAETASLPILPRWSMPCLFFLGFLALLATRSRRCRQKVPAVAAPTRPEPFRGKAYVTGSCVAVDSGRSRFAMAARRRLPPVSGSVGRGAVASTTADGSVAQGVRVFGISDIHTDWPENLATLVRLPRGPYLGDVLLVAGDVTHDAEVFLETMRVLTERFGKVCFVPGNHDVYVGSGGQAPSACSLQKHWWLLEQCARLGVSTSPLRFPHERLVIVPLLSWYHAEFDEEPDLPDDVLPKRVARRQRRMAMLGDEVGCSWPPALGASPDARNKALAYLFDAANDQAGLRRPSNTMLGEEALTFADAVAARERGDAVISFAHFLPRQELLPEKRFLWFPQLAKASGSAALRARVELLKPDVHLFGHTHFAWDQTFPDGVRYIQAPLGSPREWKTRRKTMRLEGGLPTLLWRGRTAGKPLPAQKAALWSLYYSNQPRQPHSRELGPWISAFGKRTSSKALKRRVAASTSSGNAATICLVWGIDRATGHLQRSVLSSQERSHALTIKKVAARRRFIWMRAGLRCLLGQLLDVAPETLTFEDNGFGKPRLAQPAQARRCSFNISHSGGVGAILILTDTSNQGELVGPVGVDIERHVARDAASIARRFFLGSEAAALAGAGDGSSEASEAFFEMWTKKEAWLKALGVGLGSAGPGLRGLDCSVLGKTSMASFPAELEHLAAPSWGSRLGRLPRYEVRPVDEFALPGYSLAVALPEGTPMRFESLSAVGWAQLRAGRR